MPWSIHDVDKFKKGLTPMQKERWVGIANSILENCRKAKDVGNVSKSCEEKAIRIASSMVGPKKTK